MEFWLFSIVPLDGKALVNFMLMSVKLTGVYASKQPQNVTKEITRLN
jgi:hypothetical protein